MSFGWQRLRLFRQMSDGNCASSKTPTSLASVVICLFIVLNCVVGMAPQQKSESGSELLVRCDGSYMFSKGKIEAIVAEAESGDSHAQCLLGIAYHFGLFVPASDQKAAQWADAICVRRYSASSSIFGISI